MLDQINTLDPGSLNDLKRLAHDRSPEAVKGAAKQFEAMFLQMVLKTMREATPSDGLFDSDSTRFYQGLYDQQLASVMAGKGGLGLADVLERQLQGTLPTNPPTYDLKSGTPLVPVAPQGADAAAETGNAAESSTAQDQHAFVDKLWPQAQAAARELGVPSHFLVAHAALETGWGRKELRKADGSPSHNLFNIKAGKDWKGEVVEAATTEYVNGQPQTRVERFRAYASYADAFQDYAKLMQSSTRYEAVANNTDPARFARALQAGGYATDPAYADKLTRVINGNTLRQSLIASSRA